MLAIPMKFPEVVTLRNDRRGKRMLVLVLQRENLARMQAADPIDLNTEDYFGDSPEESVELVICYDDDTDKLKKLTLEGGASAVLQYIERGRIVYQGEVKPPEKG